MTYLAKASRPDDKVYSVRDATQHDFYTIMDLCDEGGLDPPSFSYLFQYAAADDCWIKVVMQSHDEDQPTADKVIGFVMYDKGDDAVAIRRMAVAKGRRNERAGVAMFDALAEESAIEHGVKEVILGVDLEVKGALEFFNAIGFCCCAITEGGKILMGRPISLPVIPDEHPIFGDLVFETEEKGDA
jgi:ribosomal protein S18 acetylase RimI-like enzyme